MRGLVCQGTSVSAFLQKLCSDFKFSPSWGRVNYIPPVPTSDLRDTGQQVMHFFILSFAVAEWLSLPGVAPLCGGFCDLAVRVRVPYESLSILPLSKMQYLIGNLERGKNPFRMKGHRYRGLCCTAVLKEF